MKEFIGGAGAADLLGYIPQFLSEEDTRPAKEQINTAYAHGGGWKPQPKWVINQMGVAQYPGDPPLKPVALTVLHGKELILVYPMGYVAILQKDRTYEMARVD